MSETINVADYIVKRLAEEGIAHCFGVAGDYLFPICDAVERSSKVKWTGCANELNAAYAADGYARVRGAAMLATTYGVGELSALNGVMGAKAEHSLVFHVVGMPSYQHQRLGKIAHHTLGDGIFGNFIKISAEAACCHAVINPENCILEMERVIAEARRNNQPAYVIVPSDYALSPVVPADVHPLKPSYSDAALKKAVAAVAAQLEPDTPNACDLTAGIPDARNGIGNWFNCDRHMESVGVEKARAVACYSNVVFPENQITTFQASTSCSSDQEEYRRPLPACRCRAGRQHCRPSARSEQGPNSRGQALFYRPIDKARQESARRRLRNPTRNCRSGQDAQPACQAPDTVTARRSATHTGEPRAERQRFDGRQLYRRAGKSERP